MTEIQYSDELDPRRILLNVAGFRRKFHIYEIAHARDRGTDGVFHIVRKQLLNHASINVMQEIRASEKHIEVRVDRDDVAGVYDLVRHLSFPTSRTGHAGKDGSWYGLQIGIPPCSTTIRWWSDRETELDAVYKLRDKIINTVKRIIRSDQNTNAK